MKLYRYTLEGVALKSQSDFGMVRQSTVLCYSPLQAYMWCENRPFVSDLRIVSREFIRDE